MVLLAGIAAAALETTPPRTHVRASGAAIGPATTTMPIVVSEATATTVLAEPTTSTVPDTSGDTETPASAATTKRQPQTSGSSGPPVARPPQPVGTLGSSSASADGVTLGLAVDETTDAGGIRVRLDIYADTGWFRDARVDYGDGGFDPGEPFTGCLNAKTPESATPYYGVGMGWTHTYSQPGSYHVHASLTIAHQCPPDGSTDRTVATSVDITVATGGAGTNGPVLPGVILSLDHDASNPSRAFVAPIAHDDDGWIDRMTLDWGDGSPALVLVNPASCNDNGGASYPVGDFTAGWQEHQYASGSYTITVSTVSTGCGGNDSQPATGTVAYAF